VVAVVNPLVYTSAQVDVVLALSLHPTFLVQCPMQSPMPYKTGEGIRSNPFEGKLA